MGHNVFLLVSDKGLPVCRGTWFIGVPLSPDLWQPITEDDAEQIENSHQTIWRAMVNTFSNDGYQINILSNVIF